MNNSSSRPHQPLVIPISQSDRQQAQQFAELFQASSCTEQTYFDTLAVLAVNHYLEMMGIETDLLNSESWNPILRVGADISDLKLTKLGYLECRGVTPEATHCFVPQEVWENRLGYVVVEINPNYTEAKLLGFVETITTPELSLTQLEPVENLLYHLSQLSHSEASPTPTIYLRQWLESIYQRGWQPLTRDFGLGLNWQPSLRNNLSSTEIVKGAKLIDLGINLSSNKVILLILIIPQSLDKIGALVQLHPAIGDTYLLPNIQLSLLEETGKSIKQVISRNSDNFIQLPYFQGSFGEKFKIKIDVNKTSFTEDFSF